MDYKTGEIAFCKLSDQRDFKHKGTRFRKLPSFLENGKEYNAVQVDVVSVGGPAYRRFSLADPVNPCD